MITTAERLIAWVMAPSSSRQLTVMVALAGWVWQNHLHAAVGGVVRPLAFLAKHVADAVGICFVKLQRERERGRGGISEDEGAGGTRLGWRETLSYIMWALTGCFPQWKIELLEGTCCRGVATLEKGWIMDTVTWPSRPLVPPLALNQSEERALNKNNKRGGGDAVALGAVCSRLPS